MKPHFCTFFFSAFIFGAINAELDEACIDYRKNPGTCINLKECPKLLNLLVKSREPGGDRVKAVEILQQSTCGFVGQDPYVCCPQGKSDTQDQQPLHGSQQAQEPSETTHATGAPGFLTTTTTAHISTPAPTTTETKATQVSTTATATTIPSATATATTTTTTTTTKITTKTTTTTPITSPITSPTTTTTTVPTTTQTSAGEGSDEETSVSESDNSTEFDIEKLKLLPEDCGRVITFKFFYGNRTDIDDFPWTTLIEYETPSGQKFACGGALISDQYVLTAAHCVSGLQPSWKVTGVRFGEYDTSTDPDCLSDGVSGVDCAEKPVDVAVKEIITHSKFEHENPNRHHDIALLRLAEKVRFSDFIQPICLPFVHPIPQRYYTSGWGKNTEKNGTELKYMSYLTLDHPQVCSQRYKSEDIHISPHQICAGIRSTEKSCIGDEGGPLMGIEERSDYIKRVVAFGVLSMTRPSDKTCKDNGWPGVYTKVLHFLPWILHQLKE